jgi:hypothetical protein
MAIQSMVGRSSFTGHPRRFNARAERYQPTDGMFSRLDFTYDAERDVYLCPNGKPLRTSGTVHDGRVRNYLSHPGDCRVCNLKERCTRAPFRKVARDINEEARAIMPAH